MKMTTTGMKSLAEDARGESEAREDSNGKDSGFIWHAATDEGFGPSRCWPQQENPLSADRDILEKSVFNMASPSFQICFRDIASQGGGAAAVSEEEYDPGCAFPATSPMHLNTLTEVEPGYTCAATTIVPEDEGQSLSVNEIVKFAGVKFVKMYSLDMDQISELDCQRDLSEKESQDVQLVELLLFGAEKVHYKLFNRASELLTQLSQICSSDGSPIERLVYYFSNALRERIDRESGRVSDKYHSTKRLFAPWADIKTTIKCIAYHQGIPFLQVAQFTGVQAIVDNVTHATRIHIIDLQINTGVQWIVLLQALALRQDREIELLKITAVVTPLKNMVDGTGTRLTRFAKSVNIPFEIHVVMVNNMSDLTKEHFALCHEETVMVYSQFFLWSMIPQPDRLESLMKVIQSIRPLRMVVVEIEANHNSPAFVNRFIECLFFHGAFFDCLEACVDKETRELMESTFFVPAIRNIVAAEGEERKCRNVTVEVWKAFFSRSRMAEAKLSETALHEANLIAEQFRWGKSCTFESKGKSLIVGWKGTPILSVSLFEFA